MRFSTRLLLIAPLALPLVLMFSNGGPFCSAGAEDVTNDIDDDDEAHVKDSGAAAAEVEPGEEEATGEDNTNE